MKSSKAQIHARVYRLPELRFFEDQRLTSHAGLILLQALFRRIGLHDQFQRCFAHLSKGLIVGLPKMTVRSRPRAVVHHSNRGSKDIAAFDE
jgi:hypothetical protein